ncbi:VOC family protein [Actinomadura sp. DC4]|uniref:VOC family protein n=1 Tax=Actinomadura sp. DC4 TaxID=3055069 RepID=UPI0025B23D5D|nr:VOC family protein [Actinomadura sp. DC4]MDN3357370.1 VOC family protein [Actinomadura sp. DC4]
MTPEWFDVSSPDAARARTFYQEMFGWPVTVLDETYALIGEDGAPAGGIGQAGPGSPYTGVVVYFRVEDIDAALDRAERLGGGRRLDPVAVPGRGRIAVFTDADGNPVGLLGD